MAELVEGDGHVAYGAFGLRDAAFHDLVAQSAGNQVVREALARLHTHVHLFRLLYDKQVTYLAMGEHDEVLAAIAARDPDAAAYAMRRHILLSGDRFRRLFDEVESAADPATGLDAGPRPGILGGSNPIGSDGIDLSRPQSARRSRCPEHCS